MPVVHNPNDRKALVRTNHFQVVGCEQARGTDAPSRAALPLAKSASPAEASFLRTNAASCTCQGAGNGIPGVVASPSRATMHFTTP